MNKWKMEGRQYSSSVLNLIFPFSLKLIDVIKIFLKKQDEGLKNDQLYELTSISIECDMDRF